MAVDHAFAHEEMVIDEGLGYPRAYAKICRDPSLAPYNHGLPFTFIPYVLQQSENLRSKELEELFPVIDPKARPTAKPKIFINLLWKQLSHLGNAGFDPEVIRVDTYGNVLYYHADSASPLSWDIDHWFPCSRGGLTVASNLRILQWQVCKKKHNKLEFQVPWWDFQLGISVNQFLSIFASRNSDFRHRAFSFLFTEGENEEINASQTVDSHSFPQHFMKSKDQHGLAPAAVVVTRKELYDSSSALKSLDYNRQIRPQSPIIAARKMKGSILKENENPDFVANPYQAIVMARDSLKQREETNKMQAEIQKLDAEVSEMRKKNDEEKFAIQDLEAELIKRRRRAEKCRRLAEAQSSYRTMLEKMIRDAMHQSVIYKEQVRLNQAAANALMARLEAQKAICDAAEKELHKKFKQRDEIEKQIRPELEHARKRSRMDDTFFEGQDSRTVLYLPGIRPSTPSHKELRVFLEEEHKASVAGLSSNEDQTNKEIEEELTIAAKNAFKLKREVHDKAIAALEDEIPIEQKFQRLEIKDERQEIRFPVVEGTEREEDEESRRQRGKGNVDKWLQMLLENTQEELDKVDVEEATGTDEIIKNLDQKYPLKEKELDIKIQEQADDKKKKEEIVDAECNKTPGKERVLKRSESARVFRRIPSSPSLILGGMKKGVECMRKKPIVTSDDEPDYAVGNNFIKSSIKTIKKAVKI
ncbi:pleiotropic drug resistance protein 1-like [Hibiscus syriacus]|uniref:Pleiotropic drug resistance protein 1-like n=2 Tax=Hibiscus syriacus TaxID=106335 RepID=A0A6A3B257_HIBSY|nr:pleiotropic drug resistance protein 1-like [Hibiscus syriacus]